MGLFGGLSLWIKRLGSSGKDGPPKAHSLPSQAAVANVESAKTLAVESANIPIISAQTGVADRDGTAGLQGHRNVASPLPKVGIVLPEGPCKSPVSVLSTSEGAQPWVVPLAPLPCTPAEGAKAVGCALKRRGWPTPPGTPPGTPGSPHSPSTPRQVKETRRSETGEDDEGVKFVNEYVRMRKLGSGSYGKVVLHRHIVTNKLYAIKILRRSRLKRKHVGPSETAFSDVMREMAIMKQLDHPHVVALEEIIDDPENDNLYMVMEYQEGGPVCCGTGPPGGMPESQARRYFRDALAGLDYLHYHNVVHCDIKPENLLLDAQGRVKIGDFGVSHMFEDTNDELRRSPGTPAFTAPECCLGTPYRGKAADIWALGCTLYIFVTGQQPFQGSTLGELYHNIVHLEPVLSDKLSPNVKDLLRKFLQKDPKQRLTLSQAAEHPWTVEEEGPLDQVELRAIDISMEQIDNLFTKLQVSTKVRLQQQLSRQAAQARVRVHARRLSFEDPSRSNMSPLQRRSSTDFGERR